MTGLAATIARRIRREGPLSVAAFMAMALHDPDYGYYTRRDPIGRAGDFITAPEISQIFGELIGLWCADLWQRISRPDPMLVVELGPGSGALIDDFLRAAATCRVPPGMRLPRRGESGAAGGAAAPPRRRRPAFRREHRRCAARPVLLIANEFLDALPIRQLVRGGVDWAERAVALDTEDRLVFADGPEHPALTLLVPPALRCRAGSVVEIGRPRPRTQTSLLITKGPGAALFVDYGYFPSRPGPTLAALRRHQAAGVLDDVGRADLSAHVDFAVFAAAARAAGAETHGPVTQDRFLAALGAETRFEALAARARPAQRALLESGLRRLLDPAQMGNLFKVLR
jgi:NADH dehydrogenase [ubiquinone] 1 alpha subcomplex assembly factor 7